MTLEIKFKDKRVFLLLPPAADKCRFCATTHAPEQPHNATSLYYTMRFKQTHGRDATWADALAHCSPSLATLWKDELQRANSWTEHDTPIAER
jgi:hypothetical protein